MTFEKMMEQLQTEYLQSLPEKIKIIHANFEQKKVDDLRDDFHKLKGTGKTYGIPEISDLGEVVEKLCLKRPEQLNLVIPEALHLLKSIHVERQAQREFDIQNDLRFGKIKELLAA